MIIEQGFSLLLSPPPNPLPLPYFPPPDLSGVDSLQGIMVLIKGSSGGARSQDPPIVFKARRCFARFPSSPGLPTPWCLPPWPSPGRIRLEQT